MKDARDSIRTTGKLSRAPIADIVEEHLDEAAFYLERWDRALTSPHQTLAQLRDGPEEAMLAHVDGVAVGGESAANEMLWPIVEDGEADDWARVGAAVLALLTMPGQDFSGRLLARLPASTPALDPRLRGAVQDPQNNPLMGVLAERGVDPGPLALPYLQGGEPATIRSSLLAIRSATDRTAYLPIVERLIRTSAPAVRLAAVETGLLWALPAAQVACGQMAAAHEPNAMLLSALLARPGFEKPIYEALDDAELRASGLWALVFAGSVAGADRALQLMGDPDQTTARLAGEAFSSITGLRLEGGFAVPAANDDQAEGPPSPIDTLPLPNRDAVVAWWAQNRSRLSTMGRILDGQPWRGLLPLSRIAPLSMLRRHVVLMEQALQLREGRGVVSRRSLSRVQEAQACALLQTAQPR
jgi:uncharacterized protein (TIGR02270 family)